MVDKEVVSEHVNVTGGVALCHYAPPNVHLAPRVRRKTKRRKELPPQKNTKEGKMLGEILHACVLKTSNPIPRGRGHVAGSHGLEDLVAALLQPDVAKVGAECLRDSARSLPHLQENPPGDKHAHQRLSGGLRGLSRAGEGVVGDVSVVAAVSSIISPFFCSRFMVGR